MAFYTTTLDSNVIYVIREKDYRAPKWLVLTALVYVFGWQARELLQLRERHGTKDVREVILLAGKGPYLRMGVGLVFGFAAVAFPFLQWTKPIVYSFAGLGLISLIGDAKKVKLPLDQGKIP